MKKYISITIALIVAILCIVATSGCVTTDQSSGDSTNSTMTITDAFGRTVTIPTNPDKVAVVGSGSMRYFVYLGIDMEKFVAVDYQDSSSYVDSRNVRPYSLAHKEISAKKAIGPAKGVVNNEILLSSGADILFMGGATSSSVEVANEIFDKTGVPVVMFYTGNYVQDSEKICDSFRLIGKIFNREGRANELIEYFNSIDADLKSRAAKYSGDKPRVFIGGVAYNGAHGIDATNPSFYPFSILGANNVASADIQSTGNTGYAKVSKEKILEWDPDLIFVDLATLTAAEGGALFELENDPSLNQLTAVKNGNIYTLNPDTSMNANHETALANAYYVGKILYPEQFADIDPVKKADEIYSFVVGAPVFEALKANVQGLSYQKLSFNS